MSKLKFNMSYVLKKNLETKTILDEYQETLNVYLSSNINSDSVWNDYNTNNFISTVKRDKYDYEEYIKSLTSYLNIINNFCESLNSIINKNLKIEKTNNIEYDYDKLNVLINKLNVCYKKLNENYNILNTLKIPFFFKYKLTLNKYKFDSISYKNEISNLKNNLTNVRNSIESLILQTKYKIKSFDIYNINCLVMSHNYKISSMNLSNDFVNISSISR